MYFNQKAINNVQSHYQTNIMELTLLPHLMMVSISKSKEILLVNAKVQILTRYLPFSWKPHAFRVLTQALTPSNLEEAFPMGRRGAQGEAQAPMFSALVGNSDSKR